MLIFRLRPFLSSKNSKIVRFYHFALCKYMKAKIPINNFNSSNFQDQICHLRSGGVLRAEKSIFVNLNIKILTSVHEK